MTAWNRQLHQARREMLMLASCILTLNACVGIGEGVWQKSLAEGIAIASATAFAFKGSFDKPWISELTLHFVPLVCSIVLIVHIILESDGTLIEMVVRNLNITLLFPVVEYKKLYIGMRCASIATAIVLHLLTHGVIIVFPNLPLFISRVGMLLCVPVALKVRICMLSSSLSAAAISQQILQRCRVGFKKVVALSLSCLVIRRRHTPVVRFDDHVASDTDNRMADVLPVSCLGRATSASADESSETSPCSTEATSIVFSQVLAEEESDVRATHMQDAISWISTPEDLDQISQGFPSSSASETPSSLAYSSSNFSTQFLEKESQCDIRWNGAFLVCSACAYPPAGRETINGHWLLCPYRDGAPSWMYGLTICNGAVLDGEGNGLLLDFVDGQYFLDGAILSLLSDDVLVRTSRRDSAHQDTWVRIPSQLQWLHPLQVLQVHGTSEVQEGRSSNESRTAERVHEVGIQTSTSCQVFCTCSLMEKGLFHGLWRLKAISRQSRTRLPRWTKFLRVWSTKIIDAEMRHHVGLQEGRVLTVCDAKCSFELVLTDNENSIIMNGDGFGILLERVVPKAFSADI